MPFLIKMLCVDYIWFHLLAYFISNRHLNLTQEVRFSHFVNEWCWKKSILAMKTIFANHWYLQPLRLTISCNVRLCFFRVWPNTKIFNKACRNLCCVYVIVWLASIVVIGCSMVYCAVVAQFVTARDDVRHAFAGFVLIAVNSALGVASVKAVFLFVSALAARSVFRPSSKADFYLNVRAVASRCDCENH